VQNGRFWHCIQCAVVPITSRWTGYAAHFTGEVILGLLATEWEDS
jgi:hypothetical protein